MQFRKFYVDYLLSAISDQKKIFSECACYRKGKPTGYVDNCILFNKRWVPVEVKLNFDAERDLISQLKQYTDVERIVLERGRECDEKIDRQFVIIIDVTRIGVFDGYNEKITMVTEIDELKTISDLMMLRSQLIKHMESLRLVM